MTRVERGLDLASVDADMDLIAERTRKALVGRGHEQAPLVDYALLATVFSAWTVTSIAAAFATRGTLRRAPLRDVLLIGLGTTRIARLFTKESVTRPVRAPFTEVKRDAEQREVETPRGRGMVRAVGQLLTCPRCFGMWASAGLWISYLFAPAPTRVACGILTTSLINDYVNVRFAHARKRSAV